MTTVTSSYVPVWRFADNNNNPLVGGKVYTYYAGTTTPAATYTDATGTTPLTNPIILNARGETANASGASCSVWFSTTIAYKIVVQDSSGNLIWTVDNYTIPSQAYSAAYADTFTATAGQTVFTLTGTVGSQSALDVSLDGATLVNGVDFTWTSPSTLTLTVGAKAGQILLVKYLIAQAMGTMVAGGTSGQILYNNGGSVQGFTMSGDVTVVPTTGVATVNAPSSHITYTQGGTGSTSRTVTSKLQESVSVADFGAVGDGVTNDTAAFNAAIAATTGEIILDPTKTYAVNLTITKRGIRINGRGGDNISVAGSPIKNLVPYSTSSPVITVGNDSGIVGGVVIENLSIWSTGPSGNGVIGLKLGGGAYGCTFRNLEIGTAFSQYNLLLQSGTNPVAYNQFQNIQLWTAANSSLTATLGLLYGSSYTTANYFNQINITGPSGTGTGFAVVVDSCIFSMTNCWIQAENNKGVEFNNNYSNFPYLMGTNVTIDSNYSTDVLVTSTVASDTPALPISFLRGGITVDGYFKNAAATSTQINQYLGFLPYQTLLNYSVHYGYFSFYNPTSGNTNSAISVSGASDSMAFGNTAIAGNTSVQGGTGGVYFGVSGTNYVQVYAGGIRPQADNSYANGNSGQRWSTTYSGWMQLSTAVTSASAGTVSIGGTTATTVGAAGGASALPATPLGYLIGYVGTTQVKIPYYNA